MLGRRRWRIRITRSKTNIKAQVGGMGGATTAVNPPGRLYATCRRVLAALMRHVDRLAIWRRRTNMGPGISPAGSARWRWWRFARRAEDGG